MTLVFITTVLGSSTLKAFATYIGIGKDDDNEEGNGLRFRMMADENSKSETAVSKYHQIGLAFESSEPKHSSESEDGNSEYNRKKKL